MTKNICVVVSCINHGKYCRLHLQDEESEINTSDKLYLKVRAEFLKKHRVCQVGSCLKLSTEVHHKRGRSKKYKCNPMTFLAVCAHHHRFIETHPHWAKEQGYSLSRLTKSIV